MTLYTVSNGNTIFAADINQIVNAFNTLTGDLGAVVLNGSTTGTATLYQTLQGTVKWVLVQMNNFRNGSAPAQTITLPVAFTTNLQGWNSGCGIYQLLKATVAQTVQQWISQTAGADGTVSAQTSVRNNWTYHCDTGFDTISFTGSDVGTHGGHIILFGV